MYFNISLISHLQEKGRIATGKVRRDYKEYYVNHVDDQKRNIHRCRIPKNKANFGERRKNCINIKSKVGNHCWGRREQLSGNSIQKGYIW